MDGKELSSAKRALLEKWLKGQPPPKGLSGIPQRPAGAPLALSYPQQRQLFLELLDQGTAVNNLSVLLYMKGKLDVAAFEKSFHRILERHEVLRTRFVFGHGIPRPEILEKLSLPVTITDLQQADEGGRNEAVREAAEKEVLRPFDLSQAPLVRIRLYRTGEKQHYLLIVIHHTIADGWSLGVFLRELMVLYKANVNGLYTSLPELPVQYADYAFWQTDKQRQAGYRSSLDFWRKQLGGELPVLELPVDRLRGNRRTFDGSTHRFFISPETTTALEHLCRKQDATPFIGLVSVFYLLLHRYSGQEDILIGTPVANRNLPEIQDLMGVFINTLVLRATINGAESFTELLARVRRVVLDAIAHQDLPFEKLVEELKPVRDLSRTPLFQVVFNLQSAPMPDLAMEGLDTSFCELDTGVSQFEITLMLTRQGEGYHAVVEYNRHLFDASTIQRMFESFERLLLQVIECPEKEVSHYLIVSAEEMNKWADTFNQTGMELPQQHFFHRLFEQQVTLTPEAPAVVCGEVQLSYFDLNRQADMLAAGLRQYGFRNGTRIAVLMKRSADILVALLGIHKAGCTYVPLSTSFPRDRILFILQDAEVQALVSNYDCGISERDVAKVIRTDEPSDEPLKEISSVDLRPEDIAYLIYTSGSTGLPKGVMIQHGSLVNFLWSMRGRPGIMQGDRLMAVTSVSFDIAALELFLPIIAGATVVIATEEMLARPDMLAKALDQYEINIMQATPAIWQLMIETGWQGRKELKALCGGEAMPLNLAQQLLDRVESLWNMYGPTETTIWSSVNKISKGDTVITIGRPIANTQLYVLDNYGQVAPTGVMGELLIGGYGLAQGYVNLPHLTEEKFIKDHITGKPGARLYKTGDLARYLPCGSIEISGRMDDQVKINGNRIELGEIAWHLLHHPAVKDCVVCKRSMHEGGQYLIAYLLTVEGLQPDISELKAFLSKKLPPYMIPSSFVTLPSFPLSPNGKIDRKALPLPGTSLQRTGYVAPVTDQEKILVAIWQNILHLEQVGICDNFFDLGGASMQSMQMVARANMLGLKLSVEHVFEHQTIAELSAFLKQESL